MDEIVKMNVPDYRESYSNTHAATAYLKDFLLQFGTIKRPTPGDPFFTIEYFQGILLSPSEAKLLLINLVAQVQFYEEAFGPISTARLNAPPADAAPVDGAKPIVQ